MPRTSKTTSSSSKKAARRPSKADKKKPARANASRTTSKGLETEQGHKPKQIALSKESSRGVRLNRATKALTRRLGLTGEGIEILARLCDITRNDPLPVTVDGITECIAHFPRVLVTMDGSKSLDVCPQAMAVELLIASWKEEIEYKEKLQGANKVQTSRTGSSNGKPTAGGSPGSQKRGGAPKKRPAPKKPASKKPSRAKKPEPAKKPPRRKPSPDKPKPHVNRIRGRR